MALVGNFIGLSLVLVVGLAMQFVQGVSLEPQPIATGLMLLALAAVGCGTSAAFKRDPYRATRFGIVASVLVTILGCAIVASKDSDRVIPIGIALGAFGTAIALVGYVVRANHVSDTIPNLLLARARLDQIQEIHDVQWFATPTTRNLESATTVDITFQSCVDAARSVRVRLVERRAQHSAKKVMFPESVSAELMPSEVARVTLPIRALPRASGAVELAVCVEAVGPSGLRTRRFRAKQAAGWLRSTTQLQLRWIQWNAGHHLKFQLRPRTGISSSSAAPLNERWERLWTAGGRATIRPPSLDVGNSDIAAQRQKSIPSSHPLPRSSYPAMSGSGHPGPRSMSAFERSFAAPSESSGPRVSHPPAPPLSASGSPPWNGSIPAQPLVPGVQVRVHRGNSVRPAKIVQVDHMRVRCEFDDGQQAWVMPTQLDLQAG